VAASPTLLTFAEAINTVSGKDSNGTTTKISILVCLVLMNRLLEQGNINC